MSACKYAENSSLQKFQGGGSISRVLNSNTCSSASRDVGTAHFRRRSYDRVTCDSYPYCFGFLGARCFGLLPMDDPASSPWQGQASLNASIAIVTPGSFTRSGLSFKYRRRTLALCITLPCAGGHARTSAGKFGEKSIAVSIIPSHEPADRASA